MGLLNMKYFNSSILILVKLVFITKRLLSILLNTEYNGGIYRSDNYGVTWTNVSPVGYTTTAWSGISISDTGQYQTAVAYNTNIFIIK